MGFKSVTVNGFIAFKIFGVHFDQILAKNAQNVIKTEKERLVFRVGFEDKKKLLTHCLIIGRG